MNERQKKLLALSKYYEVLATAEANSPQTSARAAELARELFPPMAKPLVWVDLEVAGLYKIGRYYENWRALHWQYQFDDEKWALVFLPNQCSCAESAKAACESHHQARFLEMLA